MNVDACVMVADKLQKIHQIVRIQLVSIRLIGAVNHQQRKRNVFSKNVAAFGCHIRVAVLGKVHPFGDIGRKRMVIVFTRQKAFYPDVVANRENRRAVDKRCTVQFALIKLLIGCVTKLKTQLGVFQLRYCLQIAIVVYFIVAKDTRRGLIPLRKTYFVRKMIGQLTNVFYLENVIVQPAIVVASFERQQKIVFLHKL